MPLRRTRRRHAGMRNRIPRKINEASAAITAAKVKCAHAFAALVILTFVFIGMI
jgi:hypothetical protein